MVKREELVVYRYFCLPPPVQKGLGAAAAVERGGQLSEMRTEQSRLERNEVTKRIASRL